MSTFQLSPLPAEIQAEIDVLFRALELCPNLLCLGREAGLAVGLSPRLALELLETKGRDRAGPVVANCKEIRA